MKKDGYVQWSVWVPTTKVLDDGRILILNEGLDVVTDSLKKANVRHFIVHRDAMRRRGRQQYCVFAFLDDLKKAGLF
jgi:hypothetical protein